MPSSPIISGVRARRLPASMKAKTKPQTVITVQKKTWKSERLGSWSPGEMNRPDAHRFQSSPRSLIR